MKHFVLLYDYPADFRERRAPHRAMHIAYANASVARDELQLGGAFADDPPAGMLLFKAESAEVAEAFARADPYVVNGVVSAWRVREWTTVVGAAALTKI
ncbi:MAG: YciI-like protein [Terricaulis sp.]